MEAFHTHSEESGNFVGIRDRWTVSFACPSSRLSSKSDQFDTQCVHRQWHDHILQPAPAGDRCRRVLQHRLDGCLGNYRNRSRACRHMHPLVAEIHRVQREEDTYFLREHRQILCVPGVPEVLEILAKVNDRYRNGGCGNSYRHPSSKSGPVSREPRSSAAASENTRPGSLRNDVEREPIWQTLLIFLISSKSISNSSLCIHL